MSIRGIATKILLVAFILSALTLSASAASFDPWIEKGEGYVINNVCIDFVVIQETAPVEDSIVHLEVREWKNDTWVQINSTYKLRMDESGSISSADGNYTIKVLDFRTSGMGGSVKLEVWTNANVTNNGIVSGGYKNATGVGKAELKVTKTVTPQSISVGEMVTVTVYVENVGQYNATNITMTDPGMHQYPLVMVNTVTNNTQSQTLSKGENRTFLVYQLRATEPGTFDLSNVTMNVTNSVGVQGEVTQTTAKIDVAELAALVFTNQVTGTTVDYYTQSKIQGNITIRNIGTIPAEHIHIDFPLPPNAKIDGKDIEGLENKRTIDIDLIMPNNERIISYTVTANASGYYEIYPEYSYVYNGSGKTGSIEKITYRAVGDTKIATLLNNWYFLLIPAILLIAGALFIWKKHREYKF